MAGSRSYLYEACEYFYTPGDISKFTGEYLYRTFNTGHAKSLEWSSRGLTDHICGVPLQRKRRT